MLTDRMTQSHQNNPLHAITLAMMLEQLVERYGWDGLSEYVPVRCFLFDASIKSSLQFLRRTPWARAKVEAVYLNFLAEKEQQGGNST